MERLLMGSFLTQGQTSAMKQDEAAGFRGIERHLHLTSESFLKKKEPRRGDN